MNLLQICISPDTISLGKSTKAKGCIKQEFWVGDRIFVKSFKAGQDVLQTCKEMAEIELAEELIEELGL